jgi:hypothetical protein
MKNHDILNIPTFQNINFIFKEEIVSTKKNNHRGNTFS